MAKLEAPRIDKQVAGKGCEALFKAARVWLGLGLRGWSLGLGDWSHSDGKKTIVFRSSHEKIWATAEALLHLSDPPLEDCPWVVFGGFGSQEASWPPLPAERTAAAAQLATSPQH